MQNFTEDELAIAKSVDLVAVAASLGYTPKRIGNYYTLKEMDSMRIYNRSHWCRFSRRYEKGEMVVHRLTSYGYLPVWM